MTGWRSSILIVVATFLAAALVGNTEQAPPRPAQRAAAGPDLAGTLLNISSATLQLAAMECTPSYQAGTCSTAWHRVRRFRAGDLGRVHRGRDVRYSKGAKRALIDIGLKYYRRTRGEPYPRSRRYAWYNFTLHDNCYWRSGNWQGRNCERLVKSRFWRMATYRQINHWSTHVYICGLTLIPVVRGAIAARTVTSGAAKGGALCAMETTVDH